MARRVVKQEEEDDERARARARRKEAEVDERYALVMGTDRAKGLKATPEKERTDMWGLWDTEVPDRTFRAMTTCTKEEMASMAAVFCNGLEHICRDGNTLLSRPCILTMVLASRAACLSYQAIEDRFNISRNVVPGVLHRYRGTVGSNMELTYLPVTLTANPCNDPIPCFPSALGVVSMIPFRVEITGARRGNLGFAAIDSAKYGGPTVKVYVATDSHGHLVGLGTQIGGVANGRGLARCPGTPVCATTREIEYSQTGVPTRSADIVHQVIVSGEIEQIDWPALNAWTFESSVQGEAKQRRIAAAKRVSDQAVARFRKHAMGAHEGYVLRGKPAEILQSVQVSLAVANYELRAERHGGTAPEIHGPEPTPVPSTVPIALLAAYQEASDYLTDRTLENWKTWYDLPVPHTLRTDHDGQTTDMNQ
jgi:hypothetical protein